MCGRFDTRRLRHKLIGGHHGHPWGWGRGGGKSWKQELNRIIRRLSKEQERKATLLCDDVDMQITGKLLFMMSEVNFKLW